MSYKNDQIYCWCYAHLKECDANIYKQKNPFKTNE